MVRQAPGRRLLHDLHAPGRDIRDDAGGLPEPVGARRRRIPGLKFLDDLQAYREAHRDYTTVVNAYEPHEAVYQDLRRAPGTVIVRGSGIVRVPDPAAAHR